LQFVNDMKYAIIIKKMTGKRGVQRTKAQEKRKYYNIFNLPSNVCVGLKVSFNQKIIIYY